ncbi:MAG: hypothetical protein KDG50_06645 [Chromatiales bacterium]|nr:hypothetical protein [Chromatiales bacterium]
MANVKFGWSNAFVRLILALLLVFATYNPEGHSFYHWAIAPPMEITAIKVFVFVALLIGWVILLRATLRSLGPVGMVLAIAFFGTLAWLFLDWMNLDPGNTRIMTYVIELCLALVLAAGVSWSHVRRRISGQLDIDDVET